MHFAQATVDTESTLNKYSDAFPNLWEAKVNGNAKDIGTDKVVGNVILSEVTSIARDWQKALVANGHERLSASKGNPPNLLTVENIFGIRSDAYFPEFSQAQVRERMHKLFSRIRNLADFPIAFDSRNQSDLDAMADLFRRCVNEAANRRPHLKIKDILEATTASDSLSGDVVTLSAIIEQAA
jgi:hypothetical protein